MGARRRAVMGYDMQFLHLQLRAVQQRYHNPFSLEHSENTIRKTTGASEADTLEMPLPPKLHRLLDVGNSASQPPTWKTL